jgi:hypothetical protein
MKAPCTAFVLAASALAYTGCTTPQFRSQKREQDAQAARTMRHLVALEHRYHERNGRYAAVFAELGDALPRVSGEQGCASGYCYLVKLTTTGYELRAWPEKQGESGYRSFFADKTRVLRFTAQSRQADASDEALQ